MLPVILYKFHAREDACGVKAGLTCGNGVRPCAVRLPGWRPPNNPSNGSIIWLFATFLPALNV
jgi:hypothetical protein